MAGLLILQKPLLLRYNSTLTSSWMYGVGAVCNIVLIMLMEEGGIIGALSNFYVLLQGSNLAVATIFYLVVAEGALAYALLSFANKGLESSTVSMYACAQPMITR